MKGESAMDNEVVKQIDVYVERVFGIRKERRIMLIIATVLNFILGTLAFSTTALVFVLMLVHMVAFSACMRMTFREEGQLFTCLEELAEKYIEGTMPVTDKVEALLRQCAERKGIEWK